jgi:hypothetical protein
LKSYKKISVNSVGVGRDLLERFGERPEADRQLFRVNAIGAAEAIRHINKKNCLKL